LAGCANVLGIALLAPGSPGTFTMTAAAVLARPGAAWLAVPQQRSAPSILAVSAFLVAGNIAAVRARVRVRSGDRSAPWGPTRRRLVAPHVFVT
jgi:hypothetical protein